jgi:hypothetical protein
MIVAAWFASSVVTEVADSIVMRQLKAPLTLALWKFVISMPCGAAAILASMCCHVTCPRRRIGWAQRAQAQAQCSGEPLRVVLSAVATPRTHVVCTSRVGTRNQGAAVESCDRPKDGAQRVAKHAPTAFRRNTLGVGHIYRAHGSANPIAAEHDEADDTCHRSDSIDGRPSTKARTRPFLFEARCGTGAQGMRRFGCDHDRSHACSGQDGSDGCEIGDRIERRAVHDALDEAASRSVDGSGQLTMRQGSRREEHDA